MQNRAKIFNSFDALKGLKEALDLQEQIACERKDFDNYYIENINNKIKRIKIGDKITVKYYYELEYVETTGIVKKIDYYNKVIYVMHSKIYFDDILDIEI